MDESVDEWTIGTLQVGKGIDSHLRVVDADTRQVPRVGASQPPPTSKAQAKPLSFERI